jgi:chromosome segregation ATPase
MDIVMFDDEATEFEKYVETLLIKLGILDKLSEHEDVFGLIKDAKDVIRTGNNLRVDIFEAGWVTLQQACEEIERLKERVRKLDDDCDRYTELLNDSLADQEKLSTKCRHLTSKDEGLRERIETLERQGKLDRQFIFALRGIIEQIQKDRVTDSGNYIDLIKRTLGSNHLT